MIYLDTHILIALAQGEERKLSRDAKRAIEANEVVASAAAVLEMEMLHEIGRLKASGSKIVALLEADIGLRICDLPFRTIVEQSLAETWTRDPFGRLIVANAKARNAGLVTKDDRILAHYSRAIW